MVEVYAIRIIEEDDFANLKGRLLKQLPESSLETINKYNKSADLQRSLLGELIIRNILSKKLAIQKKDIAIEKSNKGKPFLLNNPNYFFNISHSGDWVVAAFGSKEVGIDIENIRQINFRIAERFFSKEEFSELDKMEGQEKLNFFFDLWTLKESYLKLIGKGLTKYLSSFLVKISKQGIKLIDEDIELSKVFFKQYYIDNNYKLSVCSFSPVFIDELKILSISDLH